MLERGQELIDDRLLHLGEKTVFGGLQGRRAEHEDQRSRQAFQRDKEGKGEAGGDRHQIALDFADVVDPPSQEVGEASDSQRNADDRADQAQHRQGPDEQAHERVILVNARLIVVEVLFEDHIDILQRFGADPLLEHGPQAPQHGRCGQGGVLHLSQRRGGTAGS